MGYPFNFEEDGGEGIRLTLGRMGGGGYQITFGEDGGDGGTRLPLGRMGGRGYPITFGEDGVPV